MARKRERPREHDEPAELPEARPLPGEANPGGTEGAESSWTGGSSNVGEVLNPPPRDADTTYSTRDATDVPRTDVVARFHCDRCGQAFATDQELNVHRRTAHRTHP